MKPETEGRSAAGFQPILSLGSGGMGTAWLCRALGAGEFERLVVVKRPHPHVVGRDNAMLRFLDEARLTASLHHANVVGTHQVGEDETGPFIVLEYVEGAGLDELVERSRARREQFPLPIALRIALDALSGLEAVHTAHDHAGRPLNILHRDISLQNLLVGVDGVCRVADFGAAKSDLRKYSTDQRYLLGKILYLPPEYLRRDEIGPSLDVYSLGITLWQMLAGVELWRDESEAQVVASIIEGKIPRLSDFADVPPELDALIAKATRSDPTQRFQAARLMAEAIEDLGRSSQIVATHSEVARWVKHAVGDDLAARRQRIAESLTQLSPAEVHEVETVAPPSAPKRRWPGLWTFAGVGALVVLAALAASLSRLDAPAGEKPAATDHLGNPAPAPPAPATEPPPRPALEVVPVVTATASAPRETELPAPASTRSASPARTLGQASSRRDAKSAGASPRPVSAPDTITQKNPYR